MEEHLEASAAGAYDWYRPDFVLLPEYALALFADDLEAAGPTAIGVEQLMVVADHFSPPATIERAVILRKVQDFCRAREWPLALFDGICHQRLIEDSRALPGMLIIGADSHTTTAGALGCLAMGFGGTDVFAALMTGRVALRKPSVIRVVLEGQLPVGVMGKDLILSLFGRLGPDKLNYAALEFEDCSVSRLSMSDRFAICNMMAEAGGKAALFLPDDVTEAFLRTRDGVRAPFPQAAESTYTETIDLALDDLEPMIALPHSPFNVAPLREHTGIPLEQVFLGSCNAGRLEDFEVAARILEGRSVPMGLKTIAIPGSRDVYLEAMDAGYIRTLVSAGIAVGTPSCGPCGGIDKGILAPSERCAATMNRNYPGRMGAPTAEIFLVSPATAAASMLRGKLSDPREFL